MSVKDSIIKVFPFLYTRKYFSLLNKADFSNYQSLHIEPELLLLPFFLNKDSSFVDIGSNRGLFIHAASKIIREDNILAFEPNPHLFKKLKNVFKKAHIFDYALSSKKGDAVLAIPFTNDQADDSLGNILPNESNKNAFNYKVKVDTMDSVLSNAENISLIKIDVEGNEQEVLAGAMKLIKKFKPVLIVEIEQRHHRLSLSEILNKNANDLECTIYFFLGSENKLVKYSSTDFDFQRKEDFGTLKYINNFIFIPNGSDNEKRIKEINDKIGNSSRK